MWNLLSQFQTILILVGIIGCGTSTPAELTVGTIVSTPAPEETPSITISPLTSVSPQPSPSSSSNPSSQIQLTYHSLSKTLATSSLNSIIGKGYCVIYQTKTYCWDDGVKTLPGVSMSFFGINQAVQACVTSCVNDVMTQPTYISSNLQTQLTIQSQQGTNFAQRTVSNVLNTGASIDVNCTDVNGILDCLDFQVDTNQNPL